MWKTKQPPSNSRSHSTPRHKTQFPWILIKIWLFMQHILSFRWTIGPNLCKAILICIFNENKKKICRQITINSKRNSLTNRRPFEAHFPWIHIKTCILVIHILSLQGMISTYLFWSISIGILAENKKKICWQIAILTKRNSLTNRLAPTWNAIPLNTYSNMHIDATYCHFNG